MKSVLCLPLLFILQGCCAPRALKNADHPSSTKVETLVSATHSWDGAQLPAYPEGQPEITLLKITIPPGARLPLHSHPVINAGILLRGQLVVTTENEDTITLNSGDPLIEVVHTLHYGSNPGNVPAEILVFYAGKVEMPVTVIEEEN
ncbi:MAG: cupin domain-containing protein [Kiritimatiellae bacterium]|jgi:quercetin dioxygenase-like cupin family protein|nr:cupin domain-containing protein [Kiritimatiellia bacterium]